MQYVTVAFSIVYETAQFDNYAPSQAGHKAVMLSDVCLSDV